MALGIIGPVEEPTAASAGNAVASANKEDAAVNGTGKLASVSCPLSEAKPSGSKVGAHRCWLIWPSFGCCGNFKHNMGDNRLANMAGESHMIGEDLWKLQSGWWRADFPTWSNDGGPFPILSTPVFKKFYKAFKQHKKNKHRGAGEAPPSWFKLNNYGDHAASDTRKYWFGFGIYPSNVNAPTGKKGVIPKTDYLLMTL